MHGHALPEVARSQKAVDEPFEGMRVGVPFEGRDDLRVRRKSGEIETQAPGQSAPVRLAERYKSSFTQEMADQEVDCVRAKWSLGPLRRHVGPMRFVFRPLLDPLGEQFLLFVRQLLVGVGGRHA